MADARLAAYVERLTNDPEFIRQCEETERKWNRQLRDMAEGDEAGAAEFRADLVDIEDLRRRYVPPLYRLATEDKTP